MVDLRDEIEMRLGRGEPLARVEDEVIRSCNLPEDAKSALWLYGWCLIDDPARVEEARGER